MKKANNIAAQSPKIRAFLNQILSGKKATDKARIVSLLVKGPATLETFILQGFKIQTISARLSELEDEGIVYKVSANGKDCSFYHLIDDELQQEIARKNKANEKRQAWFRKGIDSGYITQDQLNLICQ